MVFAPILDSIAPAFVIDGANGNKFYYIFSDLTNPNDVVSIQLKVSRQATNELMGKQPDGLLEPKSKGVPDEKGRYSYIIYPDDFKGWTPNEFYKIQARFITIENKYSEWSSPQLIKPISAISSQDFYLVNASSSIVNGIRENIEFTTTPIFELNVDLSKNSETVDKYRFLLYNKEDNSLKEDSGWLQANVSLGQVITHRFKTSLKEDGHYYVDAAIITLNGYQASVGQKYYFTVQETNSGELSNYTLIVDSESEESKDSACIQIKLKSSNAIIGVYVLSRASEKSNYSIWEDLYYFSEFYDEGQSYSKTIYRDFTVESGVAYKYRLQAEEDLLGKKIRTKSLYEGNAIVPEDAPAHAISLEYSYLYTNGIQLKLMYNNKMSSFKYTTQISKQDTIGSQYPTIMKNGYACYAEFPITGLISFNMDEYETFIQAKEDGYYFKNEKIAPLRYILQEDFSKRINDNALEELDLNASIRTELSQKNFFRERVFRDKVMEFLNDGKYKLYRSPQLGNKIIALTNVSFSPNETVGRMIFEFTATAYEVESFTIDNLNTYGLITVGNYSSVGGLENLNMKKHNFLGQISGFLNNKNVLEAIKEKASFYIDESSDLVDYRYEFMNLVSFKISLYPTIDLISKIWELKAVEKRSNDDPELLELEKINNYFINHSSDMPLKIIIKINGSDQPIFIQSDKTYFLEDIPGEISSIVVQPYNDNDYPPIVIDYSYQAAAVRDEASLLHTDISERFMGQLAGVFTNNEDILKQYNLHYQDLCNQYHTYTLPWYYNDDNNLIYQDYFDISSIPYRTPNIIFYTTLNILNVIKENARRVCADTVGAETVLQNGEIVKDFGIQSEENLDRWETSLNLQDGKKFFIYDDTLTIGIEADPGTIIKLTATDNTSKYIVIGPTGKYFLHPSEGFIQDISFVKPTFAIIDFVSRVSWGEMGIQTVSAQMEVVKNV